MNNSEQSLHPLVQEIRDVLDQNNCEYEYREHEPVCTSEEAMEVHPDMKLSQGAKAIILRTRDRNKEKGFIQVILPGDAKLDTKKIKKHLNLASVSFATKEQSDGITNRVEFGGIPPFGNLFSLKVFVDPTLLVHEKLIFNIGDRRATVIMKKDDWQNIVEPEVIDMITS